MKAWLVKIKDEIYATVVFAETRGKARSIAMSTDACQDADFCEIEVYRQKSMDKYHTKGKTEMDWCNANDRIALVKECGFFCDDDYFDINACEDCPAKDYCDRYTDYKEDKNEL